MHVNESENIRTTRTRSLCNPDFPVYLLDFAGTAGDYEASKKFFEQVFIYPESQNMVRYDDEAKRIEIYCFPRVLHALLLERLSWSSPIIDAFPLWDTDNLKDKYQNKNLFAMFDANFMTPQYKELEVTRFKDGALQFEQRCSMQELAHTKFDFETFERDTPQDHQTYSRVCNQLFQVSFGIADIHNQKGPRNFLLNNLAVLKAYGFTTIFCEGIYYEMQPLIDAFLQDKTTNTPTPFFSPFLRKLLSYSAHGNNHCELLQTCKKLGMRVVGIDTHFSYRSAAFIDFCDNYPLWRVKAMNAYALVIIEKEKPNKYNVFAGGGHLKAYDNKNKFQKIDEYVPGICAILNIPTVSVVDILEADYHVEKFYLVQECQLSSFDEKVEHALKALCSDENTLEALNLHMKNGDNDLLPLVFKPLPARFDIQIEACPSTNFSVAGKVEFKETNKPADSLSIQQASHAVFFAPASSEVVSEKIPIESPNETRTESPDKKQTTGYGQ